MMKQHLITLKGRSKTSFGSKIFFFIGGSLLIISILFMVLSVFNKEAGIIFAFSIILLAVGVVLHFFYLQFRKLEEIAEEIEQEQGQEEPPT